MVLVEEERDPLGGLAPGLGPEGRTLQETLSHQPVEEAGHSPEQMVIAPRGLARPGSQEGVEQIRRDLLERADVVLDEVAIQESQRLLFHHELPGQSPLVVEELADRRQREGSGSDRIARS